MIMVMTSAGGIKDCVYVLSSYYVDLYLSNTFFMSPAVVTTLAVLIMITAATHLLLCTGMHGESNCLLIHMHTAVLFLSFECTLQFLN